MSGKMQTSHAGDVLEMQTLLYQLLLIKILQSEYQWEYDIHTTYRIALSNTMVTLYKSISNKS